MKFEDLPFPIGGTFGDGATVAVTDGLQYEGKEYWVEPVSPGGGTGGILDTYITQKPKKVRIVRNLSGGALLPKTIAKMKTDGTLLEFFSQVMGNATTVGEVGYPIDEFLPAAGVAANDLFYIVVEGPAKVKSAGAGDTTISIGSMVIPSTAGRVIDQDTSVAAGAATFNQIQGAIGRAAQACAAIDTDFYIDVLKRT